MASNNPILSSDLYKDDGALRQAINDIKALGEEHAKLQKSLVGVTVEAAKLEKVTKQHNATRAKGREEIKKAATATTALERQTKRYNESLTQNAKEIEKLRLKTKQQNAENRLTAKYLASAPGSYNRMSAQYSLNKVKLNQMSDAQRKATSEGRRLEKQSNKLYQAMKRSQEATGKHTLSVGDYAKSIRGAAGNLLGKLGLIGGVAMLGRVLASAAKSIVLFEKRQSKLASVLLKSKAQIKGLTDEAKLYGLTTAFTATQVTELQVALAKLGFTQEEISLSTPGLIDMATALEVEVGDAAKVAGSALRAFNLDAAQMDRVVSVLTVSTSKSANEFADFETVISTVGPVADSFGFTLEDTIALFGKLKDAGFDASKGATAVRNILLNLADSNGKLAKRLGGSVNNLEGLLAGLSKLNKEGVSLNETLQLTDKRSVSAFNKFLTGADSVLALRDGITDVNAELQEMVDLQLDNVAGDITKLKSAWEGFILSIEAGDGVMAKATRSVTQLFTNTLIQLANIDTAFIRESKLTQENISKLYDGYEALTNKPGKWFSSVVADFDKVSFEEVADDWEKFEKRFRGFEDYDPDTIFKFWTEYIKRRAGQRTNEIKAEKDLEAAKERARISGIATREDMDAKASVKRLAAAKRHAAELLKIRGLEIATMEDGEEKELAALLLAYDRKEVEFSKHEIKLTALKEWHAREKTKIINKYIKQEEKAEEERTKAAQDLKQKEYNEALAGFDKLAEFNQSEFDLLKSNEAEKTKYRLEAEKERWLKILELNKQFGDLLTKQEVATIQNLIAKINQEIGAIDEDDDAPSIYDRLGFNLSDEKEEALNQSFAFAKDNLNSLMETQEKAAQRATQAADKRVAAAENELNREIENRNAGYAHSVDTAQKNLQAAKAAQEAALKQEAKMQRRKEQLQTLEQASNMFTASTKIWGQFGFPWALIPLGIMWGSFIAAKSKARSISKLGEGGLEFLDYGGSHVSGNDIDFGTTKSGQQRTVERGEAVAVIKKTSASKYRSILPEIIQSLNTGVFENQFSRIDTTDSAPVVVVNSDNTKMENELEQIRKQGTEKYHRDGNGNLVRIKGNTTTIYV